MKKILAFTTALLICTGATAYMPQGEILIADTTVYATEESVKINEANFPDENFRNYVLEKIDKDEDGILSDMEVKNTEEINIPALEISDLTGIEHFTDLKTLICYNNLLTTLDVSKNIQLETLNCNANYLTDLDLSNNVKLVTLRCGSYSSVAEELWENDIPTVKKNSLTALDLTNNTALKELMCDCNELTSIDLSKNTALTDLSFCDNRLTSLDLTNNTELKSLNCSGIRYFTDGVSWHQNGNQLTNIDLSKNTKLEYVNFNYNQLKSIDLSNNTALVEAYFYLNGLTSIKFGENTALALLNCEENSLTSVDLTALTALREASFNSNQLSSIDLSNNTALTYIDLTDNNHKIQLTDGKFDLSTLPDGFDISKASDWENCTIEGNIITVEDDTKAVKYKYDCGNSTEEYFQLFTENNGTSPKPPAEPVLPPINNEPFALGDVNGDCSIDSSDASMILEAYALVSTGSEDGLTDEQKAAADVNNDVIIDASDASAILAYYAYIQTGGMGTLEEYLEL